MSLRFARISIAASLLFAVLVGFALPVLADDGFWQDGRWYGWHDWHDGEPTCWISASPNVVAEGEGTMLTWGSTNATSARIDGLGAVSVNGSEWIEEVWGTRTFTLKVSSGGDSATCETKVYVRDGYGYYPPYYGSGPSCTITLSGYGYNNQRTLTWTSYNASSAYISGIGSVGTYGSQLVYPYGNQNYVMTVYGYNGQSATCQPYNAGYGYGYNYNNYYPYSYSYTYPYLQLTQIPYTGVDLGVMGTVMYWVSLALFAISGGYLLAYYQGGILRLSFAREVAAAMRNQARAVRSIFSK